MAINFPVSLDDIPSPTAGNPLDNPPHASLHVDTGLAIEAIEAKVGEDGSAVATSLDYIIKKVIGRPFSELLTGQNGAKVDFTLSHTPVNSTSVSVWQNGVRMTDGDDITISGSHVIFNIAPLSADTLVAGYNYQI
jgi:hypothetical protein